SDRVREALFSILAARVPGARVLDLFAGSGALGIEALSRGAAGATFVDAAVPAIRAIEANLKALRATAEVRKTDAGRFLTAARERAGARAPPCSPPPPPPPYRAAGPPAPALREPPPAVLAPGAVAVAESDRRAPLDLTLPLQDERRYGDTLIRFHGP